jgi:hypothetical protein
MEIQLVWIWTYQLQVSYFNSSKDINLESQNVISRPKLDTLSNGELFFCVLGKFQLFDRKVEEFHIACINLQLIFVPFERSSNFDLEMTFCELRS